MPTTALKTKRKKTTRPLKSRAEIAPTYAIAQVRNLPSDLEESFSQFLFANQCRGTEEVLDFVQSNLKYDPEIVPHAAISLNAYFDDRDLERASLNLGAWISKHAPETKISWSIQKQQDWLAEWKKHFRAFDVGGFHIVPSWIKSPIPKGAKGIKIEPGMAFGTGTHATTQYALELLEELFQDIERHPKKWRVIDVGAGSGILSVAAERLGAKEVVAVDNDPTAWRVCKKNFKLNRTKHCKLTKEQVSTVKKDYDVVVANIIDGVLMDLNKDLKRLVKPGGYLLLSGILAIGYRAFESAFFEKAPFEILHILKDDEWAAVLAKRKA